MKKTVLLLFVLLLGQFSYAQWQPTNGPYGGNTTCTVATGAYVFAGTQNSGMFRSTDQGQTWTPVNNGLTSRNIYLLAVHDSIVYTATQTGVFTSSNYGANWVKKGSLIVNFNCILFVDTTIFIGASFTGIHKTTLHDTVWTTANIGLSNTWVNALTSASHYIYAGTDAGGIFRSSNHGATWSAVNTGITQLNIQSLYYDGTKMYAGATCSKLFTSTDFGDTWIQANNGITGNVESFTRDGSYVYAAEWNRGVFRTSNHGGSWTDASTGLTNGWTTSITTSGGNTFLSTSGDGIFFSSDHASSWTPANNGLVATNIYSMASAGKRIMTISDNANIYITDDKGDSWQVIDQTPLLTDFNDLSDIEFADSIVYVASDSLLISSDSGNTWISKSLPSNIISNILLINDTDIICGTYNQGIFLSHDTGTSWTSISNGFVNSGIVSSLCLMGNTIIAGKLQYGTFVSHDYGANWVSTGLPNVTIKALVQYGTNVFAATNNGLYVSADSGDTWQSRLATPTNTIAVTDTLLFIGDYYGNLQISFDDGYTWTTVNDGLPGNCISSILIKGEDLYVGTYGAGVWKRPIAEMLDNIIVGVPDINPDPGFRIFPNPAIDLINVEVEDCTSIEILSITGQIISTIDNPDAINSIDISDYCKGLYFIKARTLHGTIVKKFIKN